MPDPKIVNLSDINGVWADLLYQNGQFVEDDELANVVKVALMTDALADIDDDLPDPDSDDRRGWWGDMDAAEIWDGWNVGCRCWLLERDKITDVDFRKGSTLARAEMYVRQAIEPLIEKKIATSYDVEASRVTETRIDVVVTIYRGSQLAIRLQFQDLWAGVK